MIAAWLTLWLLDGELVGPPAPPPKPPAKTSTEADDPQTLRLRIDQAMKAAEAKLRDKQAGPDTQQQQKQAIEDIEKLLKSTEPPPPSPDQPQSQPPNPAQQPPSNEAKDSSRPEPNTGQQPAGGSRTNQQPQGTPPEAGGASGGREKQKNESSASARPQPGGKQRERRGGRPQPSNPGQQATSRGDSARNMIDAPPAGASADRPGDANGQPGNNPDNSSGSTMPFSPEAPSDKLGELRRDVWGHLPDGLRQEVDHYYRERFMPRYQELIRQYYSKIAEAERRLAKP